MMPADSEPESALLQFVHHELRSHSHSDAAEYLSLALRERYRDAVLGILYYGSCLRNGGELDGIMDLYVLVDSYQHAYGRLAPSAANAVLPPNVYYLERSLHGRTVRSKYAVISLAQFYRHASPHCFNSAIWARFAQPCALLYARDRDSGERIDAAIATSITTFLRRVIPMLDPEYDAETLWLHGFQASFGAELRPESDDAVARLVATSRRRYERVADLAAVTLPWPVQCVEREGRHLYRTACGRHRRWGARVAWVTRRVQGKALNLLRLLKAAFTFAGGVDYLLWKIERHSGIRVEATPIMRKYPLLTCWPTLWRLYRKGAFR